MALYCLPICDECCYCIDLRTGVVIVCLLTLTLVVLSNYSVPLSCHHGDYYMALRVLNKVKYVTSAMLVVATLFLFFGVFFDIGAVCTYYCIVGLLFFAIDVATTILFAVSGFKMGVDCGNVHVTLLTLNCFVPWLILYFVIVVNSFDYYEEDGRY